MGPRSRVISDLSFGDDPDDWQGELAAAGYDWPVPNMSSIVGNLARDTGARTACSGEPAPEADHDPGGQWVPRITITPNGLVRRSVIGNLYAVRRSSKLTPGLGFTFRGAVCGAKRWRTVILAVTGVAENPGKVRHRGAD
jgi:hypothetical protein